MVNEKQIDESYKRIYYVKFNGSFFIETSEKDYRSLWEWCYNNCKHYTVESELKDNGQILIIYNFLFAAYRIYLKVV